MLTSIYDIAHMTTIGSVQVGLELGRRGRASPLWVRNIEIIGEFIRIARFILTAFFKLFMATKRTKKEVLHTTSFLVRFYLSNKVENPHNGPSALLVS